MLRDHEPNQSFYNNKDIKFLVQQGSIGTFSLWLGKQVLIVSMTLLSHIYYKASMILDYMARAGSHNK